MRRRGRGLTLREIGQLKGPAKARALKERGTRKRQAAERSAGKGHTAKRFRRS